MGRPVMGGRQLVVVEVATTGYNPRRHRVVEICATNLVTGRWWDVAVPVTLADIEDADPVMLREIGYHERGLAQRAVRERKRFADVMTGLANELSGNTLGGAYPEWTAACLGPLLVRLGLGVRWHQRLADIGGLTAGAFGLPATKIPSLGMCCTLWGVRTDDLHTAWGKAHATAYCFTALERYNATYSPDADPTLSSA